MGRGGTAVLTFRPWSVVSVPTPSSPIERTVVKLIPPGMTPEVVGVTIASVYAPEGRHHHITPETLRSAFQWGSTDRGFYPIDILVGDFNARHPNWNCPNANTFGRLLVAQIPQLRYYIRAPPTPTTVHGTTIDILLTHAGVSSPPPTVIPLDPNPFSTHYPITGVLGVGGIPRLSPPTKSKTIICWDSITEEHKSLFASTVDSRLARLAVPNPVLFRGPGPPTLANMHNASLVAAIRDGIRVLPHRRIPVLGSLPSAWTKPLASLERRLRDADPYRIWRLFENKAPVPDPPWVELEEAFRVVSCAKPASTLEPIVPPAPPSAVEIEEVRSAIVRHNLKACSDSDGINARVLRLLPTSALSALATICNLANKGDVPSSWKRSIIVPLPKPGKANYLDPKSWRPVAITSLLSRTWERVVALRLESSLSSMLLGVQYAYRRNRSATALLRHLRTRLNEALSYTSTLREDGTTGANSGRAAMHHVLFLSLDCTAAFNAANVDEILSGLSRLQCKEIAGVQAWLGSQATGLRQQCLRSRDTWHNTTSGVPQGSVLGPILWLTYIDPIIQKLIDETPQSVHTHANKCGVSAFADDVSLWVSGAGHIPARQPAPAAPPPHITTQPPPPPVAVPGAMTSAVSLEPLANCLSEWSSILTNRLTSDGIQVSTAKTSAHHISGGRGLRGAPTPPRVGSYSCTATPFKLVGMTFDQNLGVFAHTAEVIRRCSELIQRLRSISDALSPSKLRTLYSSYILPIITYAASAYINLGWNGQPTPPTNTTRTGPRARGPQVRPNAALHFANSGLEELERLHAECARIISGTYMTSTTEFCLREAGFRSLECILSRITTREDEVAARMHRPSAIAPTSDNMEPVLACLPFDPSTAARLCPHITFVHEASPNGATVNRLSHPRRRQDENDWRLARAIEFTGPDHVILATDGSVISLPGGLSVGAGAAVVTHDNIEIASATKPASHGCCSYTAECRGAEAGLDLLARDVAAPSAVIWITDSRSLVQALAKGCLLQSGYAEAHIWRRLLDLASRGIKVAVTWVFSHCGGCSANERADEIAGVEASRLTTSVESPAPWWYIDAARARWNKVSKAYDQRLEGIVQNNTEPDSHLRTLEPLKLSELSYLPPRQQKILSCLRSGAWHPLGIVHEEHPACKLCGTPNAMGRRRGVAHLFDCPAPAAACLRPDTLSLDTLWSGSKSGLATVARYALDFKRLLQNAPPLGRYALHAARGHQDVAFL
eukprot:GILI01008089.1.p1 GENE.GILI01008089.1~~GILI01008089.1.p1  ORF type:complete len:1270 (-),score=143.53 GILI01008089.1:149-3865(-)